MRLALYLKTMLFIGVLLVSTNAFAQKEYIVSNSDNDGPGSLRFAIVQANEDNLGGTIQFQLDVGEPHVILLNSELPDITVESLVIDGLESNSNRFIVLDGRKTLELPALKFKFSTSYSQHVRFLNFLDRSVFKSDDEIQVKVYPHPTQNWVYTVEVVNIKDENAPILLELLTEDGETVATQYIEDHKDSFSVNLTFNEEVANSKFTVKVLVAEKKYEQVLVVK